MRAHLPLPFLLLLVVAIAVHDHGVNAQQPVCVQKPRASVKKNSKNNYKRQILSKKRKNSTSLDTMLHIEWSRLPDLVDGGRTSKNEGGGFQDSDGGFVGTTSLFVYAFGYGGELQDPKAQNETLGFRNGGFYIDTKDGNKKWLPLPPSPVKEGRQEVAAAHIGNSIIYVGGFSYFPCKNTTGTTYSDVLRLTLLNPKTYKEGFAETANFSWDILPSFPYPIQSAGVAAIGEILYVFGGGQYDGFHFCTWRNCDKFTTWTEIDRMGARLYALDTRNKNATWVEKSPCPGTPRWVHATVAYEEYLYVIGGATGNAKAAPGQAPGVIATIVDNWRWDSANDIWERMEDLPASSGNFPGGQVLFMNRYIVLLGGHAYDNVVDAEGMISQPYGEHLIQHLCDDPETTNNESIGYCSPTCHLVANKQALGSDYYNNVFVYDVVKNKFGIIEASSDPNDPDLMPSGCGALPQNNNLGQMSIQKGGDSIVVVGGECDTRVVIDSALNISWYGHYPRLALIGKITALDHGDY